MMNFHNILSFNRLIAFWRPYEVDIPFVWRLKVYLFNTWMLRSNFVVGHYMDLERNNKIHFC